MPFLGKTPSQIVDPEVDIDGGTIDGVSIGSVTANAGAFTNLTATGTLTLPDDGISGDDVNGGTISNFASTGIDDNATSTAITIDSGQNVGVGTSGALSAKLHVTGLTNGRALKLQNVGAASAAYAVFVSDDGTEDGYIGNEPSQVAQDTMVFGTGGTERMRIDSVGRVAIGQTTGLTNPLHVTHGGQDPLGVAIKNTTSAGAFKALTLAVSGGSYSALPAWQDSSIIEDTTLNGLILSSYAGDIKFQTNNRVERMRLDTSGRLGVGTNLPAFNVDVDNADSAGTRIRVYNDARSGAASAVIGAYADDANGARAAFGNNAFPTSQYNHNVSRPDGSKSAWAWSSYVLNSTYQDQSAMTLQFVNAGGTQTERLRVDYNGQLLQPNNNFIARSYSLNAGSSYTISVPAKYGIWELVIYGAAVNYGTGAYGTRYQVYHVGSLDGYPYTAWAPTTNTVTDMTRVQTGPAPSISISAGVNGAIAVTLSGTGSLFSGWSLRLMGFGPAY